jgi:hypothetical protein
METTNTRKSEMAQHLHQWQQSNLSKKKYSDQAGIPYHTFLYWIDRLSNGERAEGCFRALSLPVAPAEDSSIEIEYPCGIRIRLHSSCPPAYIKALL